MRRQAARTEPVAAPVRAGHDLPRFDDSITVEPAHLSVIARPIVSAVPTQAHRARIADQFKQRRLRLLPRQNCQRSSSCKQNNAVLSRVNIQSKLFTREWLLEWLDIKRKTRCVVFTNGCFDLIHAGHVVYLEQAKMLGTLLVVGVNTDESVRALKGPERPILPLASRMTLLAALESVDAVVPMPETRNCALLRCVRPDIWCKGGDYTLDRLDAEERAVAAEVSARIILLELTGTESTSSLLRKILS